MKRMRWLYIIGFLFGSGGSVFAAGLSSRIVSSNVTYSTENSRELTDLRISLKPDVSAPNSSINIYLYAVGDTEAASDGVPDINAYDIGQVSVECPRSIPGVFEFGEPIVTAAHEANYQLNGREYYHVITCPYTGTGDVGQADFGYDNDNYLVIKNVINPQYDPFLPDSQLIFAPIWANFASYNRHALLTVTSSRSVEMWAVIMPQLSFVLEGVESGVGTCGVTNDRTTTGKLADFGTVDNLKFYNVAQKLSISTNMMGGYVVTAISDDQMRLIDQEPAVVCGANGESNDACLPSATVDQMSPTKTVAWTDIDQGRGLGFTLENLVGDDQLFDYNDGYRTFADSQFGDRPAPIIESDHDRESENYLCYRLVATDDNIHGAYQNSITYTVTVRF